MRDKIKECFLTPSLNISLKQRMLKKHQADLPEEEYQTFKAKVQSAAANERVPDLAPQWHQVQSSIATLKRRRRSQTYLEDIVFVFMTRTKLIQGGIAPLTKKAISVSFVLALLTMILANFTVISQYLVGEPSPIPVSVVDTSRTSNNNPINTCADSDNCTLTSHANGVQNTGVPKSLRTGDSNTNQGLPAGTYMASEYIGIITAFNTGVDARQSNTLYLKDINYAYEYESKTNISGVFKGLGVEKQFNGAVIERKLVFHIILLDNKTYSFEGDIRPPNEITGKYFILADDGQVVNETGKWMVSSVETHVSP